MLSKLFHAQSSRWGDIAHDHVTTIIDLAFRFVQSVSAFVIKDTNARESIHRRIIATSEENSKCAYNELRKLLDDEAGMGLIAFQPAKESSSGLHKWCRNVSNVTSSIG